jgi:hypothetical protein
MNGRKLHKITGHLKRGAGLSSSGPNQQEQAVLEQP